MKNVLGNQLVDDLAVDVGEAEIAARIAIGETLVVKTHELQDGGVQVVDVHRILGGTEAEFVGRSVGLATFDAAAGEPDGETPVIVVTAVDLTGVGAGLRQLDGGRAAEFA